MMNISNIIWLEEIVEKIERKHKVVIDEVEQIFNDKPKYRFVEKGFRLGDDVFAALGKTSDNRFLIVFFIYKNRKNEALIVTARKMSKNEKRRYEKK